MRSLRMVGVLLAFLFVSATSARAQTYLLYTSEDAYVGRLDNYQVGPPPTCDLTAASGGPSVQCELTALPGGVIHVAVPGGASIYLFPGGTALIANVPGYWVLD
jgi:hypothetical protein